MIRYRPTSINLSQDDLRFHLGRIFHKHAYMEWHGLPNDDATDDTTDKDEEDTDVGEHPFLDRASFSSYALSHTNSSFSTCEEESRQDTPPPEQSDDVASERLKDALSSGAPPPQNYIYQQTPNPSDFSLPYLFSSRSILADNNTPDQEEKQPEHQRHLSAYLDISISLQVNTSYLHLLLTQPVRHSRPLNFSKPIFLQAAMMTGSGWTPINQRDPPKHTSCTALSPRRLVSHGNIDIESTACDQETTSRSISVTSQRSTSSRNTRLNLPLSPDKEEQGTASSDENMGRRRGELNDPLASDSLAGDHTTRKESRRQRHLDKFIDCMPSSPEANLLDMNFLEPVNELQRAGPRFTPNDVANTVNNTNTEPGHLISGMTHEHDENTHLEHDVSGHTRRNSLGAPQGHRAGPRKIEEDPLVVGDAIYFRKQVACMGVPVIDEINDFGLDTLRRQRFGQWYGGQ
ncbi:hypothetical protein FE257_012504 [Aspergillus nanangensis]|uniref:Uncharacterized protein n=1 Tax=Aspergillus nanangensis TaxID=2582783 RepID=A0AAD4CV86_ASPNN|nr:hypothetical protein FE257_012504 [Aspergillus nanangensis]